MERQLLNDSYTRVIYEGQICFVVATGAFLIPHPIAKDILIELPTLWIEIVENAPLRNCKVTLKEVPLEDCVPLVSEIKVWLKAGWPPLAWI